MATQNHVTKRPITTGNAVRKAGAAQADDAAKLAKKVEEQEAQQLAQAEQAGAVQEVNAMTVAQAEAAGAVAAEGSIGAVSAEAAAGAAAEAGAASAAGAGAAGAAAGAAAVSPAVIGAAALGVVAVAAAAGGGSSGGGSSSPSNNGLATDKPGNSNNSNNSSNAGNNGSSNDNGNNAANNGSNTDKPAEDSKPADQSKPAEDLKPAEGHKPTDQSKPVDQPKPGDQPKPADQPKLFEGPAESELKDGQPLIAESGETKLSNLADVFAKASGNDAKPAEFIRITSIKAAEGAIADGEYGPRFIWDETVEKAPATTGKDVTDTTVVDNTQTNNAATTTIVTHAYEVIDAGKPVTYKEAQELAQKAGGKLLTIDSAKEAEWLGSHFWGQLGEYDGSKALEGKTGTEKEAIEAKMAEQLAKNGAWLGSDATTPAADGKPVVNAIIRKGGDEEKGIKTYHAEGTEPRLQHFVVEYDNYKAPLTLNGKEVEEGSTILKEDFGKLVWNSSQNKGGILTYQAVQSAEADAPVVEGSQPHTLKLTESSAITHPMVSPEPPKASDNTSTDNDQTVKPVYPDNNQKAITVEHDKLVALDKAILAGSDAAKQPAFVKITYVHENDPDTNPDASALTLQKPGKDGTPDITYLGGGNDDPVIAAADFQYLKWDSAQNAGGSFRFRVVDANGKPVASIAEQEVTITEDPAKATPNPSNPGNGQNPGDTPTDDPKKQPGTPDGQNQDNSGSGSGTPGNQDQGGKNPGQNEPPASEKPDASGDKVGDYDTTPKTVNATHDAADTALEKAIFAGKTDAKTPDAIKIVSVKASGATDEAADGSLFKLDGATKTPLKAGSVISKGDFDKLHWDATKGDGDHTIEFVPVKGNGDKIDGVNPQTFTVHEETAAPAPNTTTAPKIGDYPAEHEVIKVANEAPSTPIKESVFAGNNAAQAPDAVKIVKVSGWDGESTAAQALNYGENKNLTAGTFLDKADFGKVQWNASADNHVNGTSTFQFVPVTADHKPIDGAKVQTVKVSEAAATPVYPESQEVQHVKTLDGDVKINPNVFYGDDQSKFPMYVRLENLVENGKSDKAHNVLYIGDRNNSPEVIDTADINDADGYILPLSKMSQLHWDAAHNTGGSFQFVALDGNKEVITGAAKQTVNVTEVTAPPAQATADKLGVYPTDAQVAQAAHDKADVKLSKALFGGTSDENTPAAIKIVHVKGSGDAEVENALYKKDGSDTTLLKAGDTIVQEDFDKLFWDASKGSGDHTIEFVPVKADKSEITNAPHHSFTVHEAEAPAVDKVGTYDAQPKEITVEHDAAKTPLASDLFSGKADAPNAPDFVKILHVTKAGESAEVEGLFKEDGTAVAKDAVIAKENFGKLYWDAGKGDGQHTITFTPVKDQDGAAFDTPVEHSITVTEKPETPPAPIQAANSFGQGDTLKLGMMMGNQPGFSTKSVDTHTVISDSTNLLDDQLQHNLPLV